MRLDFFLYRQQRHIDKNPPVNIAPKLPIHIKCIGKVKRRGSSLEEYGRVKEMRARAGCCNQYHYRYMRSPVSPTHTHTQVYLNITSTVFGIFLWGAHNDTKVNTISPLIYSTRKWDRNANIMKYVCAPSYMCCYCCPYVNKTSGKTRNNDDDTAAAAAQWNYRLMPLFL